MRNIDPFGGREFDLIAHDGLPGDTGFLSAAWIGLIEVKNRPTIGDVNTLITDQIPYFMNGMASRSHGERYTMIGVIGGLIVNKPVRDYAEKNGVYVLTQRGEDGASITNADDFIPLDFVTGKDARLPVPPAPNNTV